MSKYHWGPQPPKGPNKIDWSMHPAPTMTCLVDMCHKKHGLEMRVDEYTHVFDDGSTRTFKLCTYEKEKELRCPVEKTKYPANVLTRQWIIDESDWSFDGPFNTVGGAISHIKRELKRMLKEITK